MLDPIVILSTQSTVTSYKRINFDVNVHHSKINNILLKDILCPSEACLSFSFCRWGTLSMQQSVPFLALLALLITPYTRSLGNPASQRMPEASPPNAPATTAVPAVVVARAAVAATDPVVSAAMPAPIAGAARPATREQELQLTSRSLHR
jgi:hypothetical protein